MFRFIFLFTVLHLVAGGSDWCNRHPNVCQRKHHDYHGYHRDYHRISWDIVNLDRKAQWICKQNISYTEAIEEDFYKMSFNISEFNEADITVKLKYRVLFVQANNRNDVQNPKYFAQLKVLPQFVKGKEGTWSFANGILSIVMPYTRNIREDFTVGCNISIDESVVNLPKGSVQESTEGFRFDEKVY